MNKLTSINIRDGNLVAICRVLNGDIDYSRVGIITLPYGHERTYQLNCVGVKPFSERAIENNPELERAVEELLKRNSRTGKMKTIHRGRGLRVYFGNELSGVVSLGRRFDKRTIWDYSKRELVDVEYLGLGLQRYSPEVKGDFLKLADYLDERNRRGRYEVRRAA